MATFGQIVGECELCSADEAARATRPLSSFGIFLTLHSSTGSKCHLHQGTVCTRLCKHEILTRLLDRFPDGQWYVSEAQDEAQDEAALRQDAGPSEGDDEDEEESPLYSKSPVATSLSEEQQKASDEKKTQGQQDAAKDVAHG